MENRLRGLADEHVATRPFEGISQRADKLAQHRRRMMVGFGTAATAAAVIIVLAFSQQGPGDDVLTTSEPSPQPAPTAAVEPTAVAASTPVPDAAPATPAPAPVADGATVDAGPRGVVRNTGAGSETITTDPSLIAFLAGDTVTYQLGTPDAPGAIVFWQAGSEIRRIEPEPAGSVRLFDAGFLGSSPTFLIAASRGYGPDDYAVELALEPVDPASQRVVFEVDAGWENGVQQAAWDGVELVAALTAAELQVHVVGGAMLASLPAPFDSPDSFGSLIWVRDELWVLNSSFDADSRPHLRIRRFDAQLRSLGDESTMLSGEQPGAGFCTHAEWDASTSSLLCNQSGAGPLRIDPATGAAVALGEVPETTRTLRRVPSVSAGAGPCEHGGASDGSRLLADLDGDGSSEEVQLTRAENGTTLTVCNSTTISPAPWELGDVNKPATVTVVDAEDDGVDELLIGAPTGSAQFAGSLARLGANGFEIDQSTVVLRPPLDGAAGESGKCVDTDGDGLAELVPVTYELVGGDSLVEARSMEWRDGIGGTGTFAIPEQRLEAWLTMIGVCGRTALQAAQAESLFAVSASDPLSLGTLLPSGDAVWLGLGADLLTQRTTSELADENNWIIDEASYQGWEGPFSVLETLQLTSLFGYGGGPVQLTVGPHAGCSRARPEQPALDGSVVQLSIQPVGIENCSQWYAINVFANPDGTAAAITLERGDFDSLDVDNG